MSETDSPQATAHDAAHTFIFADLAGFAALTEAMGDHHAARLAGDFFDAVAEQASTHRAEVVKTIGDAVMLRGDDATAAIALGIHIVSEVGGRRDWPIVRVGMHTGPAVARGADWFGATVNIAARVSAIAGGGEVLMTSATRDAAEGLQRFELTSHGARTLKNVAEPVTLFEARKAAQRDQAALPLDPVCRMAVDPGAAAGRLAHDGQDFVFCSLACAGRFASDPEHYARATS